MHHPDDGRRSDLSVVSSATFPDDVQRFEHLPPELVAEKIGAPFLLLHSPLQKALVIVGVCACRRAGAAARPSSTLPPGHAAASVQTSRGSPSSPDFPFCSSSLPARARRASHANAPARSSVCRRATPAESPGTPPPRSSTPTLQLQPSRPRPRASSSGGRAGRRPSARPSPALDALRRGAVGSSSVGAADGVSDSPGRRRPGLDPALAGGFLRRSSSTSRAAVARVLRLVPFALRPGAVMTSIASCGLRLFHPRGHVAASTRSPVSRVVMPLANALRHGGSRLRVSFALSELGGALHIRHATLRVSPFTAELAGG